MGIETYTCDVTLGGAVYRASFNRRAGTPGQGLVPVHCHPHYELHAADGACVFGIDGVSVTLPPGGALLLRPGVYHRVESAGPAVRRWDLRFECLDRATPFGRQAVPAGAFAYLPGDEALSLLRRLGEELASGDACGEAVCRALVTLLLALPVRCLTTTPRPPRRPVADDTDAARAQEIDAYFANRCAEEPRAGELAARLGLTTRQLERVLRSLYGCTWREKLAETRLSAAKRLLRTTPLSVGEIAARAGYAAPAAFCAAFRAAEGTTPSRWRRAQGDREKADNK